MLEEEADEVEQAPDTPLEIDWTAQATQEALKPLPGESYVAASLWKALQVGMMGFLVNCQPSEPFLSKFLIEEKLISENDLVQFVWPTFTAGLVLLLVPMGFAAEKLGYWTVILAGLVFRQSTRAILVFGQGLPLMRMMQVTYAGAVACDTVYFASVLLVVPERDFALASAVVFGMYRGGNVLGSSLGELSYPGAMNLLGLFYFSWIFTTLGTIWFFCCFPKISSTSNRLHSLQFNQNFYSRLSRQAKSWVWALVGASGASLLWSNYYQLLFYDLDEDAKFGLVEALIELAGMSMSGWILFRSQRFEEMEWREAILIGSTGCIMLGLFDLGTILTSKESMLYIFSMLRSAVFTAIQVLSQATIGQGSKRDKAIVFTSIQMLALILCLFVQFAGRRFKWNSHAFIGAGVAICFVADFFIAILFCKFHVQEDGFSVVQQRLGFDD